MINLRHPGLRVRDIRKIISYKHQEIKWEKGLDEKNEWVFVSLENELYERRLLSWLSSKNIPPTCELLWIDPSYSSVQRMRWGEVLSSPQCYFGTHAFNLYDIDLKWVLEYSKTQVARFGRISEKADV
jgi:hypothetical protein